MTTPAAILDAVSSYYNVKLRNLLGPGKWRRWSHPRSVAMYLLRQLTDLSYPQIGALFMGRHHTTAMAAVKTIEWRIEEGGLGFDAGVVREVEEVRLLLAATADAPPRTSEVGSVSGIGNAPDARAA